MKKRIIIIAILLLIILGVLIGINKARKEKIYTPEELDITLRNILEVEFLDKVRVSEFVTLKEGKIKDNYLIDTTVIGEKTVDFVLQKKNRDYKSSFVIKVVDSTEPIVWLKSNYYVTKGMEDNLKDKIMCGDNYDDNPTCEIIGEYDLNTAGSYALQFSATDSSGNKTIKDFTLTVKEPIPSSNKSSDDNKEKQVTKKTYFSDIISKHKNENTQIGIDISKWQGDVDFYALKEAGVEFVIIRVGSSKGIGKERFVDSKFEQNITRANEAGIPVGIYYYSYANSSKSAIADAKWILKQIKGYQVDLPIAFDWENWSNYNEYHLSFYKLTKMAEDYLDVFKDAGYDGMLYSSKTYLENIWLKTNYDKWLAHYVDNTTYEGDYSFWQLCDNGRVDGINGDVDIDIRHLN